MSKKLTDYYRDVYLKAMELLKLLLDTMEKHFPKPKAEASISARDYSKTKPDCYKCSNRNTVLGSCHSECTERKAVVIGDPHGIKSGWFFWPYNFDPCWLVSCDSFKQK